MEIKRRNGWRWKTTTTQTHTHTHTILIISNLLLDICFSREKKSFKK
jgi:hypothetical protein